MFKTIVQGIKLAPRVKHIKFRSYSGPMIKGTVPYELEPDASHLERAFWLTTQVESGGKFGSVMGYDGTGCTAGLHQCVAVYPRELAHEDGNPEDDQGSLWQLIADIRYTCPGLTDRFDEELKEVGWKATEYGKVVNIDSGTLVNGRAIREELTPNQGRVPSFGPDWDSAKGWTLIFYDIFSNPCSFPIQIEFGLEEQKKIVRARWKPLKGKNVEELIYEGNIDNTDLFAVEDKLDLAMSMFFCYNVNGPVISFQKIWNTLSMFKESRDREPNLSSTEDRSWIAKRLIRQLGTSSYGRWSTNRYRNTRKAAMKVWPREFFIGQDAIMPKNL